MNDHRSRPNGLRAILRNLSRRPEGVHSSDAALTAWDYAAVGCQARKLVALGELFKGQVSAREVRYFSTAAARDAYLAAHTGPRAERAGKVTIAPSWRADAPVHLPVDYLFTVCPRFTPRFQAFEFAHVHGGGRGPSHA